MPFAMLVYTLGVGYGGGTCVPQHKHVFAHMNPFTSPMCICAWHTCGYGPSICMYVAYPHIYVRLTCVCATRMCEEVLGYALCPRVQGRFGTLELSGTVLQCACVLVSACFAGFGCMHEQPSEKRTRHKRIQCLLCHRHLNPHVLRL